MQLKPKRIAELIKKETSEILREKVADPRIGFASITDVELTPDLKFAKIFVSIFGTEEQKIDSIRGLESATKFIRGELAKILNLRAMPAIRFVRDDSLERGSRVLGIMQKLKNEQTPTNKKRLKKS